MVKRPSESVTVNRELPISTFFARTVAPTRTAPESSVKVPEIRAVATPCACRELKIDMNVNQLMRAHTNEVLEIMLSLSPSPRNEIDARCGSCVVDHFGRSLLRRHSTQKEIEDT